ncbi:uncharacterized protein KY384_004620 [Bacidia gigantensis]|uniref:uncharacterized protein n=1 Tax=Bacidia gigantensis TaxID=2732470 RepID=UPI001D0376F8|nr:uncharacterized protein KY384_004620 [Bacidia gigantensis]KAG8531262.1 hypothetical protein KY384_004620 [Bacidia gigantensis]
MALTILLSLTSVFSYVQAGPVPSPARDRPCATFMLPVSATAQNAEYDIVPVADNINATAYAVDHDTWSFNNRSHILRNITVSGTYNISVQLCVPPHGIKKQHLFIATHGGLFDKRYWDSAINPSEYSFVDNALAAGYSILTYDRLGNGLSDKPSASTSVQAPLQLEILRGITEMALSGALSKHTGDQLKANSFDKLIHVGHSFGSVLTTAFLTKYGTLSSAAIITGFIPNPYLADMRVSSFSAEYAPLNDPVLFSDRSQGYLVNGQLTGFQSLFFSPKTNTTSGIGGFDKEVFDYAFSIRQTITTTELLAPQASLGPALQFEGPVQADCGVDFEMGREVWPRAKKVEVYTQPGNGHALTLHRRADVGYKATFDYLEKMGL